MFNRDIVDATVVTYGGVDEYGQMMTTPTASREISMTFGLYNHSESSDVRYMAVNYTGLTRDKEITDKDSVIIGGKEYKVLFVNPYGRLTQVFLQ
jgi:hypothetical protein